LLQRTLVVIRDDFDEITWQAFWRLTVENHSTADLAAEHQAEQPHARL
jgi:hypothetical protein